MFAEWAHALIMSNAATETLLVSREALAALLTPAQAALRNKRARSADAIGVDACELCGRPVTDADRAAEHVDSEDGSAVPLGRKCAARASKAGLVTRGQHPNG